MVLLSYPGDACKKSEECQSNSCIGGKCIGFDVGQKCNFVAYYTYNVQCNPGLFCNFTNSPSICANLRSPGDFSLDTDTCAPGSGYYKIEGICREYSSIPTGKIVQSCSSTNFNQFCSSNQCYTFANGTSICINAFKNVVKYPFSCDENFECISNVDKIAHASIYGTCTCGYASTGNSYCSSFLGDGYRAKYIAILKEWDSSEYIQECHVDAVYTYQCLNTYWTKAKTAEFLYYSLLGQFDIEIKMVEIEPCATAIYVNKYATYKELYHDAFKKKSFGALFGISALIISIIA